MKKAYSVFGAILLICGAIFVASPIGAMLAPNTAYLQYARVVTAGTAVQLYAQSTKFYDLTVCANGSNTGVGVIGSQQVLASQFKRTGVNLAAGNCTTFGGPDSENGNLTDYYVDSTASTDQFNFLYRTRK